MKLVYCIVLTFLSIPLVPIQHRGTEAKHLESANDQLLLSDNVPQDFKRLMEPLMPEPLPPACQPYFPGYPAQHSYKQTPVRLMVHVFYVMGFVDCA